jgi:energy-converting hydrogenase A subunit M
MSALGRKQSCYQRIKTRRLYCENIMVYLTNILRVCRVESIFGTKAYSTSSEYALHAKLPNGEPIDEKLYSIDFMFIHDVW